MKPCRKPNCVHDHLLHLERSSPTLWFTLFALCAINWIALCALTFGLIAGWWR